MDMDGGKKKKRQKRHIAKTLEVWSTGPSPGFLSVRPTHLLPVYDRRASQPHAIVLASSCSFGHRYISVAWRPPLIISTVGPVEPQGRRKAAPFGAIDHRYIIRSVMNAYGHMRRRRGGNARLMAHGTSPHRNDTVAPYTTNQPIRARRMILKCVNLFSQMDQPYGHVWFDSLSLSVLARMACPRNAKGE